jgi:hypothetical protein
VTAMGRVHRAGGQQHSRALGPILSSEGQGSFDLFTRLFSTRHRVGRFVGSNQSTCGSDASCIATLIEARVVSFSIDGK